MRKVFSGLLGEILDGEILDGEILDGGMLDGEMLSKGLHTNTLLNIF